MMSKGKDSGEKKFERKQWTIDDVRWRFILTMNAIYAILKVFDYSYISRQIIDQKKNIVQTLNRWPNVVLRV